VAVSPQLPHSPGAVFDFHPSEAGMDQLLEAWMALTFAVNSINRSMGLHDLYPFVLGPSVVAKLTFVQQRIRAVSGRDADRDIPKRTFAPREKQNAS
jgi:hypothetical protein